MEYERICQEKNNGLSTLFRLFTNWVNKCSEKFSGAIDKCDNGNAFTFSKVFALAYLTLD